MMFNVLGNWVSMTQRSIPSFAVSRASSGQVDEKENKTFGGMFDRVKHDKEEEHECDCGPKIEEIEETEEADEPEPEPDREQSTQMPWTTRENLSKRCDHFCTRARSQKRRSRSLLEHLVELNDGVAASRVSCEWRVEFFFLQIQGRQPDEPPFGFRLGDFFRRVDPKLCKFAVWSSRTTLTLVKQEKVHWFNLLQTQG